MTTETGLARKPRRKGRSPSVTWRVITKSLGYTLLIAIALLSSIPLLWMISTSLKEHPGELLFPPELIPNPWEWHNYIDVWTVTGIHRFFLNSLLVTITATAGSVLTASMVGFGFARIDFPGRTALFVLMLSTMMLPEIVMLVPTFVMFRVVGWIDTPMPLIVPYWFGGGAFYIFLIRQFMLQLPKELDEAAFADGASYFRIYWNIILPLMGPALATVAIFSVVARWNDFLGPLIFLNAETWRTLALALRTFLVGELSSLGGMGGAVPRWNLLMVSGEIMMLPVAHCYSLLRGAEVFHQRNCANRTDWTVAAPTLIDYPGLGLNQPIRESNRCVAVHASDAEGSLAEFVMRNYPGFDHDFLKNRALANS